MTMETNPYTNLSVATQVALKVIVDDLNRDLEILNIFIELSPKQLVGQEVIIVNPNEEDDFRVGDVYTIAEVLTEVNEYYGKMIFVKMVNEHYEADYLWIERYFLGKEPIMRFVNHDQLVGLSKI